ncbi:MAG: hypothetical protein LUF29_06830, partial [Oscillospiraceae bacterium]|nr:hypothetical protein [Oscillospiraceae bacterium]
HTCSVCGDSYVDTYTAALGHTYGEPVFTWAEDYSTAVAVFTCTSNDDRQTVAATIDSETTEAKCESDGVAVYTATAVFNGTTYTDKQSVVLTATGHTAGTPTIENEVAATCTTDGSYDTVTRCTVCDAIISRVTTTVPATGHTYEAVVTAPTCTETGYTTYTCSVCGDSYVADETAALGHSYVAVVTSPTCTEQGYTTHTCSVCGDSYVDTYTAALGHTYEFQYFTWSNDLSSATATFKCKTCGDTQVIDATISGVGSLGVSVHTASVTFEGETYSDSVSTGTSLLKTAADYTAVNEAIEKANALNASDYTNFEIVTAAIDLVNWNLSIVNQETVNAYAGNIEAAIANLTPLVEETVTITEPIEDSTTETEPEEVEVTESEPETNPTTGVVVALLPMAMAMAAIVAGKKRLG